MTTPADEVNLGSAPGGAILRDRRWTMAQWIAQLAGGPRAWMLAAMLSPVGCTGQTGGNGAKDAVRDPVAAAAPERLADGVLLQRLEGHWQVSDPLGTPHSLEIEGARWTLRIEDQAVRVEHCTAEERVDNTLWFRCRAAPEDPDEPPDDGESEPPTVERGLAWDDGALILRPLDELRWSRVAPTATPPDDGP